jgi:hypothetical protein
MAFSRTIRLGLVGLVLPFLGCSSRSDIFGEEINCAFTEVKKEFNDFRYEEIAKRLQQYDILYFGETHPVDCKDSSKQPLFKMIPILKALTDPRVIDKPYTTLIVESLPVSYDFDNSRFIPENEERFIQQGILDKVRTPVVYDFVSSEQTLENEDYKGSFGPVHSLESLYKLVEEFGNTGLKIRGSLPTTKQFNAIFERVFHNCRISRFSKREFQQEGEYQFAKLIGLTTQFAVLSSMIEDSSRGIKPRIIVYGGKIHNDSSTIAEKEKLSFRDISLREKFSRFEGLNYGAIDIINLDTDSNNFYDRILQKEINFVDNCFDVWPTLKDSSDKRFADHFLIFGKTN